MKTIAKKLDIPQDQINITGIRRGSVIVDFVISGLVDESSAVSIATVLEEVKVGSFFHWHPFLSCHLDTATDTVAFFTLSPHLATIKILHDPSRSLRKSTSSAS
jgi:hypothetical protein